MQQKRKSSEDLLNQFKDEVRSEIMKEYRTVEEFCFVNDIQKSLLSRFFDEGRNNFELKTLFRIASCLGKAVKIKLK